MRLRKYRGQSGIARNGIATTGTGGIRSLILRKTTARCFLGSHRTVRLNDARYLAVLKARLDLKVTWISLGSKSNWVTRFRRCRSFQEDTPADTCQSTYLEQVDAFHRREHVGAFHKKPPMQIGLKNWPVSSQFPSGIWAPLGPMGRGMALAAWSLL